MPMDRFRRVASVWNWLPAFRGVAEHESIQQAASSLGVSASALSRTVKLLEDATGIDLFVRHPAGLRLTDAGRDLLLVTRDAMRTTDDFIDRWRDHAEVGPTTLTIGCVADVVAVSIARALPIATSAVRLAIRAVAPAVAEDELLQGNVDLVLTTEPAAASEKVESRALGRVPLGLYSTTDVPPGGDIPLVVPSGIDVAGRVVASATSIAVAMILAKASGAFVILPDAALADAECGTLVRMGDHTPPLALHAVYRSHVGPSRTGDAVRAVVAALEASFS